MPAVKTYKIVNTTVKQPKVHPKTKKDLRNMTERVGHGVSIRLDTGVQLIVETTRPRIVDHINEGMLRLQRGGFIRIEEIADVGAILKKHTYAPKTIEDALSPDTHAELEAKHPSSEERVAKAVLMGESKAEHRENDSVNPDGEPNFVVTASKDLKRKPKTKVVVSEDNASEE